jgi:hypothetical protein
MVDLSKSQIRSIDFWRTHYGNYWFEDGAECLLYPRNRLRDGDTVTDDSGM